MDISTNPVDTKIKNSLKKGVFIILVLIKSKIKPRKKTKNIRGVPKEVRVQVKKKRKGILYQDVTEGEPVKFCNPNKTKNSISVTSEVLVIVRDENEVLIETKNSTYKVA